MSGEQRRARVASSIRSGLSELVSELSDPRIRDAGLASINHVELNRDMSVANAYVSFIGGPDDEGAAASRAISALSAAAGRLRGPLGRKLNLKRAPQLRFFVDDGAEFRERLAGIISGGDGQADGDGGERS